jgi:hypothetical protein
MEGAIHQVMISIPFHVTDWNAVSPVEYPGEAGIATWRSLHHGDLRIRLVEYSAGYLADHWCSKGHLIFCIAGSMTTELTDGRRFDLRAGMSYEVSDNLSRHRSSSSSGVRLLIVDGAFLRQEKGIKM